MTVEQAARVRDRRGQVYVDMSDMLMYLHHHTVVSGIQRVIAEVQPHLEREGNLEYVAFAPGRGVLTILDRDDILAMLELVRHSDEARALHVQATVDAIADSVEGRPELLGGPGDVLAILGAGWTHDGLFRAVQRLKESGVAVVVLMYDLIPVVFPGFAQAMIQQFREYVPRVAWLADRAPAISQATRRDFERYCTDRGWRPPPGAATRLAGDQWAEARRQALGVPDTRAWDRPYVLFVSTIESRKNHILALRCWQRLLAGHGAEEVPDLVCVGRLGWNVFEFLEEFEVTSGLGGRLHLLTESISDARLAALYRDCLFTIYPSRYEGWGLPIGESLDWGKPVIASTSSSLPEVGGDFVRYFEDNDLEAFHGVVDRYVSDPSALTADAQRIERDYRPPSWADVARVLASEVEVARRAQRPFRVDVALGAEYGLKRLPWYDGGLDGEPFLQHLEEERRLPLTGQLLGVERSIEAGLLTDRELGPTGRVQRLRIDLLRPAAGELFLVVATTEEPGEAGVVTTGPRGMSTHHVIRGEALIVELGSGEVGAHEPVIVAPGSGWTDANPIHSFVLVDSRQAAETLVTRNLARLASRFWTAEESRAMTNANAAAELEMLTASLSWRITRPLRDAKALFRARRSR